MVLERILASYGRLFLCPLASLVCVMLRVIPLFKWDEVKGKRKVFNNP